MLFQVLSAWDQLKTIVNKLKKKSKKDNLAHESNAFLVLFLQLGLHLFQDPDGISEVLEVNVVFIYLFIFAVFLCMQDVIYNFLNMLLYFNVN